MKKTISIILLFTIALFNFQTVMAQTETATAEETTTEDTSFKNEEPAKMDENAKEEPVVTETADADEPEKSGHQVLKEKFIEGGAGFMALPLICLILGLAISVERIISLNWISINTNKFINQIDSKVSSGDLEGAKELSRNTRGPIASIFYQGLDRSSQGSIDVVEKSVISYGSVQMGQLEKGLVWISLFIALAPMLGFMGTVIGMIEAFDEIERVGDISPTVVAGGIKVALLTTVAGLVVAIILQLFYNYLVSKVDSIVNTMEEASISLVDILVKNKVVKA